MNKVNLSKRKSIEIEHSSRIKKEISHKIQYFISMIQNKERNLCDMVDAIISNNCSLIDLEIASIDESAFALNTYIDVSNQFQNLYTDNVLLQLKPLLNKRSKELFEKLSSPIPLPTLDTVAWAENCGTTSQVSKLIDEFGEVRVTRSNYRSVATLKFQYSSIA